MKATLPFILLLAVLTACNKKEDLPLCWGESTYIQVNVAPSSDPVVQHGYIISLIDDEKVDIVPTGDIIYRGTYSIKGNILEISIPELSTKFIFTIISDNELFGEYGQIMQRQNCD